MADIVISYKREEQQTASALAEALLGKGWTVWWDPSGERASTSTTPSSKAIRDAKCVIVLWSKLSTQSEYVKDEANCFVDGPGAANSGWVDPGRNKAVAMRVFDKIFNQGKFQVADEIYAPVFQNHGLHRSMDLKTDQEEAVHTERKAFPDLRMSVQEMVAERDKAAVLWTFQGTHTNFGYEGLPLTGTRVEVRGITIGGSRTGGPRGGVVQLQGNGSLHPYVPIGSRGW